MLTSNLTRTLTLPLNPTCTPDPDLYLDLEPNGDPNPNRDPNPNLVQEALKALSNFIAAPAAQGGGLGLRLHDSFERELGLGPGLGLGPAPGLGLG